MLTLQDIHMRYAVLPLLLLASKNALAAAAGSAPQVVTVSVDSDLLVLFKGAIWVGGIFLAIFAFVGVAFFGWDVRKARASLADAQNETRKLLAELKADFVEMKVLKENLEQLGAQLQEGESKAVEEPPLEKSPERTPIDLIREVIRSSDFEWTTIGRIVKRTQFTRENVLDEVRKASDIRIGNGKKTQDFIFRFKE